ncbi:MAG: hypothetical protein CFE34_19270 [Rhodobacteraceae bacterium PARR1]|nr:MAG: hypothetical protein CFE34_19270 [Rhodobacteraceae bacterium PARR1]
MTLSDLFRPLSVPAAFARYESVRARLPQMPRQGDGLVLPDLSAVADHVDGFLLDAFGVLNVGGTAIPGAVARIAALRAAGKRLCVLTNAASYTRAGAVAKYRRLGFDFTADEVVTSREVAAARLAAILPGGLWGAISAPEDDFHDIPARLASVIDDPALFDRVEGFLFLSSVRWTPALQDRLARALTDRPRPLVVANPDLVAPTETGLSLEPGLFAHDLIDRLGVAVHWFGKPYPDAFDDAVARLGLARGRVAMVGDTLHTDVLGGAQAGMRSVLITGHGLFRGHDAKAAIAASGLHPDFVIPTT